MYVCMYFYSSNLFYTDYNLLLLNFVVLSFHMYTQPLAAMYISLKYKSKMKHEQEMFGLMPLRPLFCLVRQDKLRAFSVKILVVL